MSTPNNKEISINAERYLQTNRKQDSNVQLSIVKGWVAGGGGVLGQ